MTTANILNYESPEYREDGRSKKGFDFQAYYNGRQFLLDNGKFYIPMNTSDFKRHVKRIPEVHGSDLVDHVICQTQTENFVSYSDAVAGKDRGIHSFNGSDFLVTVSPKQIDSAPGDCPTISRFLVKLFGNDARQLRCFMGWMKTARLAFLDRRRQPGQALALAGPVQCGKTRAIHDIIAPAMGNRCANPWSYLSGKTAFNSHLLKAEVLVIDDEQGSPNIADRRKLADGIKSCLYADQVNIAGKGKTDFECDPLWRICIAVNDGEEALRVLPPITGDIDDKLTILKCAPALSDLSPDEFPAWQKAIRDELPAFLHKVENFNIREDERNNRSGVKAFRHPDIVRSMEESTPEAQVMELIQEATHRIDHFNLPWTGTAGDLFRLLQTHDVVRRELESHCRAASVLGKYLGRLEGKGVERMPGNPAYTSWRLTGETPEFAKYQPEIIDL